MLIDWLKKLTYKIDLPTEEVLGRIKSKTVFSNKLNGRNDLFEGSFKSDTFEIYFMSEFGNWYKDGFSPRFCGKVTAKDGYTELTIRSRPMLYAYLFLPIPLILFVVSLLIVILKSEYRLFVGLLFSAGFSFFVLASYNSKYESFKSILEVNIFHDVMIK